LAAEQQVSGFGCNDCRSPRFFSMCFDDIRSADWDVDQTFDCFSKCFSCVPASSVTAQESRLSSILAEIKKERLAEQQVSGFGCYQCRSPRFFLECFEDIRSIKNDWDVDESYSCFSNCFSCLPASSVTAQESQLSSILAEIIEGSLAAEQQVSGFGCNDCRSPRFFSMCFDDIRSADWDVDQTFDCFSKCFSCVPASSVTAQESRLSSILAEIKKERLAEQQVSGFGCNDCRSFRFFFQCFEDIRHDDWDVDQSFDCFSKCFSCAL